MSSRKGRYKPINPKKYRGDSTNIIYRSNLEYKFMYWLDMKESVVQWSSEEFWVPYRSPKDNRVHRYFPDFWVMFANPDGATREIMIEVKPDIQTRPPASKYTKKGTKTKGYFRDIFIFGINEAKWKAAREYCLNKGWEFQIITEKQLK